MIIVILEAIEELMDVIEIMVDELAEGWFSPLCWGSGWISNYMVGNPPIWAAKKYKICRNTQKISS